MLGVANSTQPTIEFMKIVLGRGLAPIVAVILLNWTSCED